MTAQIGEVLYLNGRKTWMVSCPPLPDERVVEVAAKRALSPDERDGCHLGSTANWRGYIGHWSVDDGRVYFLGLQGRYQLARPLFADWFSGQLVLHEGKRLKYVHMGFASTYERERYINVVAGLVTSEETITNNSVEEAEARREARWRAAQPEKWARSLALRQAEGTPPGKRSCTRCGMIVGSYRKTCPECGLEVGRLT